MRRLPSATYLIVGGKPSPQSGGPSGGQESAVTTQGRAEEAQFRPLTGRAAAGTKPAPHH